MIYWRLIPFCFLAGILAGCQSPQKSCCRAGCQLPAAASAPAPLNASVLESDAVWQDDRGNHFRLAELRGHPVAISMFFADCEGVCVITKNDMKAIEASLPAAARVQTIFVLVTLAPDRDTPMVLKEYRTEQGLSEKNWRLLRGSTAATAQLAAQLQVGYGRDRSGLFRHSSEITVLDKMGKIILQQEGIHADLAATVRALVADGRN